MRQAVQVHTTPRRPGWSVMELCGRMTVDDGAALVHALVDEVSRGVTQIVIDARHLESSARPLSPLLQRVGELLAQAGGTVVVTAPPSELGDALSGPSTGEQRRITLVGHR